MQVFFFCKRSAVFATFEMSVDFVGKHLLNHLNLFANLVLDQDVLY